MVKKVSLLLIFFILAGTFVFAQRENITIKVAVIGPGDALYFWWGHIALVVEETRTRRSQFYDYGIFDFSGDNFFFNFAMGRLWYSCGASPSKANYDFFKRTNRDVVIYTLNLPPETKRKIRDFAAANVLPENKYYFYHHFRDNCSTRIRDIIDLATDGQFKEEFENEKSRFTLRQQVRRHTWFSNFFDWLLNFLMGQVIDRPITVWEDMFLPSEVGRTIEDFYYTDINGEKRKLVLSKEIFLESEARPGVLETPRRQWPFLLIFSLVLSAIFGLFFYMQMKNIKAGRVLAGISMSICSLFFGILGIFLYFLVIFSNHDYTFENLNVLFCTPLLIAGFPIGLSYAFTKKQEKLEKYGFFIRIIWFVTLAGIFLSMLIKILPWFYQDNLASQMLMLPIALLFTLQPNKLKEFCKKYCIWAVKFFKKES